MSISNLEMNARTPNIDELEDLSAAQFSPGSVIPSPSESWTSFLDNHELTINQEDEVFALSVVTSALLGLAQSRKDRPPSAFVYSRLCAYHDELATQYLVLHPPILHGGNALQPEDEIGPLPYEDIFVK